MTVFVATHKQFDYPLPQGYQPLLVGADYNANPDHYLQDNQGENISAKNPQYCELTAVYWMWKNDQSDYVGLSHYRRYFSDQSVGKVIGGRNAMYLWLLIHGQTEPISEANLKQFANDYDWVVATPELNSLKSSWQQYSNGHYEKDLVLTRQIIAEQAPAYLMAFDLFMKRPAKMSPYNMFYTNREQFNQYCAWLFKILEEVERRVDMTGYDQYQQRLFGFLAERLLNVYLLHHQELKVKYLTVFNTGDSNRKKILRHLTNALKITKDV